jgi:type IV pilus biogenesis protein CpaD/CtpE
LRISMKNLALVAAAAALLAGCASADLAENTTPQPEKQYRTGSNIPRRAESLPDSVGTATVHPSDNSLGTSSVPVPRAGGR